MLSYLPTKPAYDECLKIFGDRVCIFSNSAGSSDDAEYKEAIKISKDLGIHVIRHNEKVQRSKDAFFNNKTIKQ